MASEATESETAADDGAAAKEEKTEKERIEEEKRMERERIEEAEIESYPTPRVVVRDIIDYKVVKGPLDLRVYYTQGARKNDYRSHGKKCSRVEQLIKSRYPQTLWQQISFLSQHGYELENNFSSHEVMGPYSGTEYNEVGVSIYSKGMVKYGPPRYETPYTWKKAEEASREAIAFGEAIAAEEARRKAKDAAK